MLAKLSADILDKLDIFVLEIEELRVPQVKRKFSYINGVLMRPIVCVNVKTDARSISAAAMGVPVVSVAAAFHPEPVGDQEEPGDDDEEGHRRNGRLGVGPSHLLLVLLHPRMLEVHDRKLHRSRRHVGGRRN